MKIGDGAATVVGVVEQRTSDAVYVGSWCAGKKHGRVLFGLSQASANAKMRGCAGTKTVKELGLSPSDS